MSRRMYEVISPLVPRVEPYSIDEMFIDFAGVEGDLLARSVSIRAAVHKVAKIPTCVGIGPTKTIAKLANAIAKKDRNGPSVADLSLPAARASVYSDLATSEVWGLGPASVKKLKHAGVETVADFVAQPDDHLRKLLSVTGLRTKKELEGMSCLPFSLLPPTRKSLAVTRSFGHAVTTWEDMREALSTYTHRAAEKLRHHGLIASAMQVFMRTSEFNRDPYYSKQITLELEPTADSFMLMAAATRAGHSLWRDGYRYAKAGVIMIDLARPAQVPVQLFPSRDPARSAALMRTLDAINSRYGRDTLRPGGTTARGTWSMRRANISPCYTARFDEILCAKA